MIMKISKTLLVDNLKKVSKAVNSKIDIPVLSGILVAANENGVIFTGSSTEFSIRSKVLAGEDGLEILQEGSIVLPAKEFLNIAKALPDYLAILQRDGLQVKITSGKSEFTLNGMNADEYPKLQQNEAGSQFIIESPVLKEMIEKTAFACSKSEIRPILTGVHLFEENGRIGMVATDSYRLSKIVEGEVLEGNIEGLQNIVIPQKTLKEIGTLIEHSEQVIVRLMNNGNYIGFETEGIEIFSKLLDGNYPDTNKLIPIEHNTLVKASRTGLLSAIERSMILQQDNRKVIKLKISNNNNSMFKIIEVFTMSDEVGKSQEQVVVEDIQGEELEISFNPEYLSDALKALDDEQVIIEFNGSLRPFVVKPTSNDNHVQLVLPIRTY